jgi:hypothetical protein
MRALAVERRCAGLFLACAFLLLAACASIPPESVDLSKQIGVGIGKSRAAHLSTLDAFYRRLKEENDGWVNSTFLPRVIANTKAGLAAACKAKKDDSPACTALSEADIAGLVKRTAAFRDELQRTLENNRDEASRLIADHYADLAAANSVVTGLLASAVSVRQATADASKTLGELVGVDIDTQAIEKSLDEYLQKAGTAGAKITDFEAGLSKALDKLRKK